MTPAQVRLIQDLAKVLLPVTNPIPYLTRLAAEFEGNTVDTTAIAQAEAALLTYGPAIANTVQGEESRRAADEHVAPYAFAAFAWTPGTGDPTSRIAAVAAGLQQLYDSTIHQDEPAPPSP